MTDKLEAWVQEQVSAWSQPPALFDDPNDPLIAFRTRKLSKRAHEERRKRHERVLKKLEAKRRRKAQKAQEEARNRQASQPATADPAQTRMLLPSGGGGWRGL